MERQDRYASCFDAVGEIVRVGPEFGPPTSTVAAVARPPSSREPASGAGDHYTSYLPARSTRPAAPYAAA